METVLQIVFLVVVFACFTVVFSILGGIRSRENHAEVEPEQVKPREPEKHIRNAQIARAILSGCPASEVQRYFSGFAEESFLSKSRIYAITRNVCKKCGTWTVHSNITMAELRQHKNKFLPVIEEYLEIYGPVSCNCGDGSPVTWKVKAGDYVLKCVGGGDGYRSSHIQGGPGGGGDASRSAGGANGFPGRDYNAVGPDGGYGKWLPRGTGK